MGRDLRRVRRGRGRESGLGGDRAGPLRTRRTASTSPTPGTTTRVSAHARIYRVPEPGRAPRPSRTRRAEVLEVRYPARGPGRRGDVRRPRRHGLSDREGSRRLAAGVPDRTRAHGRRTGSPSRSGSGNLPIDSRGASAERSPTPRSTPSGRPGGRAHVPRGISLRPHPPGHARSPSGVACDATGLQLQGEGISWLDDRVLVLTSEGGFGSPAPSFCSSAASSPLDH